MIGIAGDMCERISSVPDLLLDDGPVRVWPSDYLTAPAAIRSDATYLLAHTPDCYRKRSVL